MSQSPLFQIAVIRGDGIGAEVIDACILVLEAAGARVGGYQLDYLDIEAGAGLYQRTGEDIAATDFDAAGRADAILLGAIGLPSVRHDDGTEIAPHLRMRDQFGLYAGVRPAKAFPNIDRKLTDERAASIDLVVLRESTEGLFYSHGKGEVINDQEARETLRITRATTEKLHDFAFRLAARRKQRGGKGKVTCVDKANVFRAMAFFRKIFDERAAKFPDIEKDYAYVDAQALNLIRKPWEYDVMVMENMFGDILSDLVGALVGGMGMAACGEMGDSHGLFQPAHGTAPDIAGQGIANPMAAILSGALMLDWLADRHGKRELARAAMLIEDAVQAAFEANRIRPKELGGDQGSAQVASELLDVLSGTAVKP